ncbi:MAG: hypothetical protein KC910_04430 [Candidatus Eremiobacteraeota bacterium]|nr:hypothetical protein [Candidatus Eremiobacteraeota bacterium]
MIDWEIRRLERDQGEWKPGALVGTVRAFGGVGQLEVLDEDYRRPLEELFTQEQFVLAGREPMPGGGENITADQLEPWSLSTLELVKRSLPARGLVAEERSGQFDRH